jgi:DASH complex subunit DAD3
MSLPRPNHPEPPAKKNTSSSMQMSSLLLTLSNNPSAVILDGLRGLERKTSLVFTLLKASVYSIVLNQQIETDNDGFGEGEAEDEVDE